MTTTDTVGSVTRSTPVTVRSAGRLYVRPGSIHGHIVERVDVTARRLGEAVYLYIDGARRSLAYELTREQFATLAAVLDAPEAGR